LEDSFQERTANISVLISSAGTLALKSPATRGAHLGIRCYNAGSLFSEISSWHCGEVGMTGDYPRFQATYTHEALVEHFLLSPAERAVVDTCYGDVHRHSVAVLLKAVQ
jgi:hypothetical protein